jgi:hypothetical protein
MLGSLDASTGGGVVTGRVGRGSVEGTERDQGQSSRLGVGSQGDVLYRTVLHHMAPEMPVQRKTPVSVPLATLTCSVAGSLGR